MRMLAASTIAATALAGGCFEPRTKVCKNGALCPASMACTETSNLDETLCGGSQEVAVCATKTQNDLCDVVGGDAGISGGYCNERVCIECDPNLSFCPTNGWESMAVAQLSFTDLWVASSQHAYAVAPNKLFEYKGREWIERPEFASNGVVSGVWGAAPDDLFLVTSGQPTPGSVYRNTTFLVTQTLSSGPKLLKDVWGTSANDVVVVGAGEQIGSYNGTTWRWDTNLSGSFPATTLNGIHGTADGAYAVGEGVVLKRTTGTWALMPNLPALGQLRDVWVAPTNEVFVVGGATAGEIHIFNGSTWASHRPNGLPPLASVWGTSAMDVWAVGDLGAVLHYDGTQWSPVSGLPSVPYNAVAGIVEETDGVDAVHVFIAGNDGVILRNHPR